MAEIIRFPRPKSVIGLVALSDLPDEEPLKPWHSGFPEFRHKLELAPGTLSVCTGHPGHGKTTLMANIWFNTVAANKLNIVVATFETRPKPHYQKLLRQFWARMPQTAMTGEQIREADEFLEEHYRFIRHPRPTLDFILEYALKAAAFDVLVIDPWNRLETQRERDETETEHIAYALQTLHNFAEQQRCHVQIIAHPAKREARLRDGIPTLEDIAGSKHWDNVPDQGFVVYREKFWDADTNARRFDAKLYHLKARFEELGHPCAFDMRLNPQNWCFEVTA